MRTVPTWSKENAETAIALVLASGISVLGIVDVVSVDLVSKAIPLTLAVFAFALLRERWKRDLVEKEIARSAAATMNAVAELSHGLERVAALDAAVVDVGKVLADLSAVRVLTGEDITTALYEARRDTEIWIFKGGTGTFTRVVTLPECVQNARRHRRGLRFYLEILDPTDLELCERYVRLYKSLAENPDDNEMSWDGFGTQHEVYATILAACWYRQRYQLLDIEIEVRLSRIISTLRWDFSSSSLIVTQRGPTFPAMMIEKNKIHYALWHTELWTNFGQSRRLPLENAENVLLSARPTIEETRRLFIALGIELAANCDDVAVSDIIRKGLYDRDPYTRGAGDHIQVDDRR